MNHNLHIRPMQITDAEAVVKLSHQLGYEITQDDFVRRFNTVQGNSLHFLFVVEHQNQVIAWFHFEKTQSLILDDQYIGRAAVVDSNFRNQNIGSECVRYAIDFVKKRGAKNLSFWANLNRVDAHRFYEREGFTHKGKFFSMSLSD